MARGKRTSSAKIAEVIAEKIKNPDAKLRDITKSTGVNRQTVSDILKKEAPELLTNSDYKSKLINVNMEIIKEGKEIIFKELKRINKKGWVKIHSTQDIKSLSSTLEDAFKQNQLLNWLSTENKEINIKIVE